MAEDYKLIDNEEKHRYEFQIDGKIAEIDYIKSRNIPCTYRSTRLIRRQGSGLTTSRKSTDRH